MSYLTSSKEDVENKSTPLHDKPTDQEALIHRFHKALKHHDLSVENDKGIKSALGVIHNKEPHEITPELADEVEEALATLNVTIVDDDGELSNIMISGNEQFGLDIGASKWLSNRVSGLESLLETNEKKMEESKATITDTKEKLKKMEKIPLVLLVGV